MTFTCKAESFVPLTVPKKASLESIINCKLEQNNLFGRAVNYLKSSIFLLNYTIFPNLHKLGKENSYLCCSRFSFYTHPTGSLARLTEVHFIL